MQKRNSKFHFGAFIILIGINLAIGLVASFFTRPEIPGWYAALRKPSFNPPPWLFAPVWTSIYIIIAIAAYLVWARRNGSGFYKTTAVGYFIQLWLNFMWSIVFFGMHEVFAALVVILLLWLSIVFNMICFAKFSRAAAWLLLPYLLWVGFASLLNLNIYLLNR